MFKISPNEASGDKTSLLQQLYAQTVQGAGGDEWNQNVLNKLYPDDSARISEIDDILSNTKRLGKKRKADLMDELLTINNRQDTALNAMAANPFKTKLDIGDGQTVNSLANTANLVGANIKAHPFKAAGLGIGAGMNIAGLFDNDKIGGQLLGTGAGVALPALLTKLGALSSITPMGRIGWALGGGALGSLYDKLMAKKEEEQAMAQQYAQMR